MTPLEYAMKWDRRLREASEEATRRWAESRDRMWVDAQRRIDERQRETNREIMEMRNLT